MARDPAVNTAVVPVPRLEDDCSNWWTRHAELPREHARAEVAAGIRAIREKLRVLSPATHELVRGVLQRGHAPGDFFRAPIMALNAILPRELVGDPQTTSLDIGARFLDAQGKMAPELMPDGTHPSESGYAIWGRALVESVLLPDALALPASPWPVAL